MSGFIHTRLVKGSDLAVGRKVRILAGPHAGAEGHVVDIFSNGDRSIYDHMPWPIGIFAPADLEPLEDA